jgi:hypothetical protein
MTGHNGEFEPWIATSHGKAIAMANTACGYLHKNLITFQRGVLDLLDGERAIGFGKANRLT